MKTALLLLAVLCCSGCTLTTFVADVHPFSRDITGRPQIQVKRCALKSAPFVGLYVDDCATTTEPIDTPAPR
jgi:hypothetical protein